MEERGERTFMTLWSMQDCISKSSEKPIYVVLPLKHFLTVISRSSFQGRPSIDAAFCPSLLLATKSGVPLAVFPHVIM